MNYSLRKENQFIYYNLDNFISDVPDIADIRISINHINNKRRLDIDVFNNYTYSYRIYLDDYFNTRLLAIIDDRFGSSFASNSNCLYGNVSAKLKNMYYIKARLTHLRKFKLPKQVDLIDMCITLGFDDTKWVSKFLK